MNTDQRLILILWLSGSRIKENQMMSRIMRTVLRFGICQIRRAGMTDHALTKKGGSVRKEFSDTYL